MKSLNKLFLATFIVMAIQANPSLKAQSEFSSPTISIGVVVSDLEKSLDFYTNVIGMKKVGEFDIDEDLGKTTGLTAGLPFHVDVLKLHDQPEATSWKLMSFGKKASHPMPQHIEDDTGVQYITINVKSLKPFLARIKQHNVELLGDTPVPLGPDRHFILVQDPDGTFVELIGGMD
jgi:catechol 2,3-dioxygenase-like lactoylglutathione lyase family enzyme